MPAPLANVEFAHVVRIRKRGVEARIALAAGDCVGLLVYMEWDERLPVVTALARCIQHDWKTPSCVVRETPTGVGIVAARAIAAGERLTLSFRWGKVPWYVPWPLAEVPRPLRAPPLYEVTSIGVVHGRGVVAARALDAGTTLGVAIARHYWILPVVTRDLARFVNHSWRPNAVLVWAGGVWMLQTSAAVRKGGEITVDYRTAPSYCARPEPAFL